MINKHLMFVKENFSSYWLFENDKISANMKLHFWIIHDFLPVFFIEWGIFFSFPFSRHIMYRASMREYEGVEEKKINENIFFRWLAVCYVREIRCTRKISSRILYVLSSLWIPFFLFTHPFYHKTNLKTIFMILLIYLTKLYTHWNSGIQKHQIRPTIFFLWYLQKMLYYINKKLIMRKIGYP